MQRDLLILLPLIARIGNGSTKWKRWMHSLHPGSRRPRLIGTTSTCLTAMGSTVFPRRELLLERTDHSTRKLETLPGFIQAGSGPPRLHHCTVRRTQNWVGGGMDPLGRSKLRGGLRQ